MVGQTGQKEDTDLARPPVQPLNIAGAHKILEAAPLWGRYLHRRWIGRGSLKMEMRFAADARGGLMECIWNSFMRAKWGRGGE